VSIADLFHPLPAARFLAHYYNAAPFHAPGTESRFEAIDSLTCAQTLERELEAAVAAESVPAPRLRELHRNERDLIVLQVSGAANWKVFGNGAEAAADVTFTARAEPGSAVYVPRGFWNSCAPDMPASRQLEFRIHNPTAVDFLMWLTEKAKELEVYQSDLPRFAAPAVQAAYLKTLRRAVGGTFRTPGLLEAYARRLNRHAGAATIPGRPDEITLATRRIPKVYRHDTETIYLSIAGRDLFFPIEAAPLLQYVIDRAPAPVSDFYSQFIGDFDADELSSFLAALIRDDVIAPVDLKPQ
jgi:hypothetical protein